MTKTRKRFFTRTYHRLHSSNKTMIPWLASLLRAVLSQSQASTVSKSGSFKNTEVIFLGENTPFKSLRKGGEVMAKKPERAFRPPRLQICELVPITDPARIEAIDKARRHPLAYAGPQVRDLLFDLKPRHRLDLIWELVQELPAKHRAELLRLMNGNQKDRSDSDKKKNGKR